MIRESDLDEAIAECQGKKNPDASTCMKLAAFYTIKQHMFSKSATPESNAVLLPSGSSLSPGYSFATGDDVITLDSGTEFAQTIKGRKYAEVMPVIDEAIDTLRVINPRFYDAVMRKLA